MLPLTGSLWDGVQSPPRPWTAQAITENRWIERLIDLVFVLFLQIYYHGEPINVNVHVTNNTNKTVKKMKISGYRQARLDMWLWVVMGDALWKADVLCLSTQCVSMLTYACLTLRSTSAPWRQKNQSKMSPAKLTALILWCLWYITCSTNRSVLYSTVFI